VYFFFTQRELFCSFSDQIFSCSFENSRRKDLPQWKRKRKFNKKFLSSYRGGLCSVSTARQLGAGRFREICTSKELPVFFEAQHDSKLSQKKTHSKKCLWHKKKAAPFLCFDVQRYLRLKTNRLTKPLEVFRDRFGEDFSNDLFWQVLRQDPTLFHWHRRVAYCRECYCELLTLFENFHSLEKAKVSFLKRHFYEGILSDDRKLNRLFGKNTWFQKKVSLKVLTLLKKSKIVFDDQISLILTKDFQKSFFSQKFYENQICPYTGSNLEFFDRDHVGAKTLGSGLIFRSDPTYNRLIKKNQSYNHFFDLSMNVEPFLILSTLVECLTKKPVRFASKLTGTIEQQLQFYLSSNNVEDANKVVKDLFDQDELFV
jgi:hypothetical protein